MEDIFKLVRLFVVGLRSNVHVIWQSAWYFRHVPNHAPTLRNTHCYPDTVNASVRVVVNWGKVVLFILRSQCRGHMITRSGVSGSERQYTASCPKSSLLAPKSDCSLGSGPHYLRVNFIKQFPGVQPLEL